MELREQAGLTQQELAGRAGLSKAGVADLEQGRREPSIALAEALGAEVTAFLEEPAKRSQTGRGRPPKRAGEPAERPAPKRARGRPPRSRP
jgi:transcriptional regulator with XRE-family HTH domain